MDQHAIKAEIRRRAKSIEGMAREMGVSGVMLRKAFLNPSTRANALIADFLGYTTHELWPDWFDEDGDLIPRRSRLKLSRARQRMASPESTVPA